MSRHTSPRPATSPRYLTPVLHLVIALIAVLLVLTTAGCSTGPAPLSPQGNGSDAVERGENERDEVDDEREEVEPEESEADDEGDAPARGRVAARHANGEHEADEDERDENEAGENENGGNEREADEHEADERETDD